MLNLESTIKYNDHIQNEEPKEFIRSFNPKRQAQKEGEGDGQGGRPN